MSHISKIDTKIQDMGYLMKALKTLGMEYIQAENGQLLTVCGYGKNEDINGCLMEIKTGSKYGIGIRQTNGKYEFVADWWAIETFTGQKEEELLNKLTRQYAYETVMDKVKGMGYSVVQENEDAAQNVRITVRRWK